MKRSALAMLSLVCLLGAPSAFAKTAPLTAKQVGQYAEKHGDKAALNTYFWTCMKKKGGCPAYGKIETGDKAWVALAARLIPESDAAVSESLHSSLAKALAVSPEGVLPYIDSSERFSAASTCLPFLSNEEPPAPQLAYVVKLRAKLESVQAPELQKPKDACLAQVAQMETILTKAVQDTPDGAQ